MKDKQREEYIDEKVHELWNKQSFKEIRDIIRTIIGDCKPKVSIKIFDEIDTVHYYTDRKRMFKRKLEDAGMEVER